MRFDVGLSAAMPNVFISYRRADADLLAHSICGRLRQEFGEQSVFIDVDAIPPGIDFRRHLKEQVNRCDVLLAVIAENWLEIRGTNGKRRLDDPQDFVRIEIEQALARNILVIPVVYGEARMPNEAELPVSMRNLAYRNAVLMRSGKDIGVELKKVISAVRALPTVSPGPQSTKRAGSLAFGVTKRSFTDLLQKTGWPAALWAAFGGLAFLALLVWFAISGGLFRPSVAKVNEAGAENRLPGTIASKDQSPTAPTEKVKGQFENKPETSPQAAEKTEAAEIVSLINDKEPMRWIRSRNTGKNAGPARDGVWKTGKVHYNSEDTFNFLVVPSGTDLYCEKPSDDIYTEQVYGDVRVELEFLILPNSNSGVFLMGEYEINILDRDRSGEILRGPPTMAIARKPAGQWQSFDITFRAPRFSPEGIKIQDACFLKVLYNGRLIYENASVANVSSDESSLTGKESAKGPLLLQGSFLPPIAFRNIRIIPLNLTLGASPN